MGLFRTQQGFAIPMVLMLGVGLTFVMGNLINAGSNDAELRSELLTQRQAAESLMFAEDLGTQALFLAASAALPATSALGFDSCFDPVIASGADLVLAASSAMATGDTGAYAAFPLQRSGHALAFDAGDALTTTTLGQRALEDVVLDLWIRASDGGVSELVRAGGRSLIAASASSGDNPITLSIASGSATLNLTPDIWHHLQIEKDGTAITVTLDDTTNASASVDQFYSQGETWTLGDSAAASPLAFQLAAVRGWVDRATAISGQIDTDRTEPGETSSTPDWSLYFDGLFSAAAPFPDWVKTHGQTTLVGSPSVVNVTISDIDYGDPVPPLPSETYLLHACASDERLQRTIERKIVLAPDTLVWE